MGNSEVAYSLSWWRYVTLDYLEAEKSAVRTGLLTLFIVDAHFDAEIYVAGFASKLSNPESMSRSQRTFLRLAKGAHVSHRKQVNLI